MEDVGTHRRHARAAADEQHLPFGVLDEKFAVRARHRHLVARTEAVDIGGSDTRTHFLETAAFAVERRGGNAHVQHHNAVLRRMVRHRIGPHRRRGVLHPQPEKSHLFPVAAVRLVHLHPGEIDITGRYVNLDIAARTEVHRLPFRQLHHKLLDECGYIPVGQHLAFPLLDAEELLGNLDFHILAHLHLTEKAVVFSGHLP